MNNSISRIISNKKILILGFGREGISTYKYLLKHYLSEHIVIADQHALNELPQDAQAILKSHPPYSTFFGPDYLLSLKQVDLVMLSPGVSPYLPEIIAAKKAGIKFTSQTALFLQSFSARSVGVTGTKGKSTTASLITHVLKSTGRAVELVGNIERPVFDLIDQDQPGKLYVYELSSHQLAGVTTSPHIAVFLNFYPEHLDYYPGLAEYFSAKTPIAAHQSPGDVFIYNSDFPQIVDLARLSKAKKLSFSPVDKLPTGWQISLIGQHNITNAVAAALALNELGLKDDEIKAGLASFAPLKYRLNFIGTYRGIEFYDDALATLPEATIAALDALAPRVNTLIAGGFERQQEYKALACKIIACEIKTLILFPTTGSRIEAEIKKLQHVNMLTCYHVNTMADAVKLAYTHTPEGSICLLSAGAPSFGLFKDYKDRSDQYRKLVKSLELNTN